VKSSIGEIQATTLVFWAVCCLVYWSVFRKEDHEINTCSQKKEAGFLPASKQMLSFHLFRSHRSRRNMMELHWDYPPGIPSHVRRRYK
jgi:hypothetical protein